MGFGLAAGAALPVVAYLGNEYHATVLMTVALLVVMIAQLGRAPDQRGAREHLGHVLRDLLRRLAALARGRAARVPPRDRRRATARGRGARLAIAPESGAFLLTFTLAVVVWSDAGAYFAGRAYGERKLAPRISPGKTVEGAIGGVLGGTIAGLVFKAIFDIWWPELSALAGLGARRSCSALILSVAAIVGDLVESLLKRDAQVKDAGAMLPGHGRRARPDRLAAARDSRDVLHDALHGIPASAGLEPSMIERYSRPEMAEIFSEEGKYARWLEVELAVCEVHAERGLIPPAALAAIRAQGGRRSGARRRDRGARAPRRDRVH